MISPSMAKCIRSETVVAILPDELIFEVLIRLPGKQLGRCKCVCRSWRSLIGSSVFSETYRSIHRILLLHWSERIERDCRHLRFYQSHIRQLHEPPPPPEEFSQLHEIVVDGSYDAVTQPVNGLVAVVKRKGDYSSDFGVTIHSILTGEAMKIPEPQRSSKPGAYHLGYDPASRMYKLLKLRHGYNHPLVNIMSLRPSTLKSSWRVLKSGPASITSMNDYTGCLGAQEELRTFPGDGVLCWIMRKVGSLVLFDLHREKFRAVKLPAGLRLRKRLVPRARFELDRLALSLWVFPQDGDNYRPICICFVMEDSEGKKWRKSCVELPGELPEAKSFAICIGGGGEFMLINTSFKSRAVYKYSGGSSGMERFQIGIIPHNKPLDLNNIHCGYNAYSAFSAKLSCLPDSSHLYLLLDHVLGGLV